MQIQTNGDNGPVQMTEVTNFSPDGTILSKSLNLTLRNSSVGKVWKTYLELKKLIDGKVNEPKKRTKKETQKEKVNTESENPQKKIETCPECGGMLVEKSGISRFGKPYHFKGCANFVNGCKYSRNIALDEAPIPIPDEDLLVVDER